jgi:hypothetical protein
VTYGAGAGPAPSLDDQPVHPLPDRPTVPVDEWIDELRRLRRRLAELEARLRALLVQRRPGPPAGPYRGRASSSSAAARWPLRRAPSMRPDQRPAVCSPAKWRGPTGRARRAGSPGSKAGVRVE